MDSQITFNQVKVQILNDTDATPSPKYPGYVGLKAEYDPEVSEFPSRLPGFFFKWNSVPIKFYSNQTIMRP
jgi:hypothetical protein